MSTAVNNTEITDTEITGIDYGVEPLPHHLSCDVVVVGYGPVGMVLSGLLAQRGLDVVAVERHPERYRHSRAGHYDSETMRIFQSLGVADAIELVAQPELGWSLIGADGEVLTVMKHGQSGGGWKLSYLSYQPEVEAILDARARELGVRVYMGATAEGIAQDADRVTVTCRPTAEPRSAPRTIEATYLVGCDGANSFVRTELGVERVDLGFDALPQLVIDFKLFDPDRELPLLPEVCQILDPMMPGLAGRWQGRGYMRFEFNPTERESLTPEELAGEESCWGLLSRWDITPDDGVIARRAVYQFEAKLARDWRKGRAFLAGDAAHTMPPTLGEGLCSGMRDAANLAWKLASVVHGEADQPLLDTYQSERGHHARGLTEMSIAIADMLWFVRDAEQARQRDQMLREGHLPDQTSFPRLGTGVVMDEEEDTRSVVGRPSPQGRVARDRRVDRLDEFGSGWKIIARHALPEELFSDEQRRVLRSLDMELIHVSRGPGPDYYIDLDGDYDLWFREHGVRAYIERPDKYVFGAVAQIDEVPQLLDALIESLAATGGCLS